MKIKDIFKTLKGIIHVFIKYAGVWVEISSTNLCKYWNYKIDKVYARDCNVFDVYLEGEYQND